MWMVECEISLNYSWLLFGSELLMVSVRCCLIDQDSKTVLTQLEWRANEIANVCGNVCDTVCIYFLPESANVCIAAVR